MATKIITNHRWIYHSRPEARVGKQHYRLQEEQMDTDLAAGELLLANQFVSVDPYMRIQQAKNPTWEAPHPLNQLQQSGVISKVIASRVTEFPVGQWVSSYIGWEKYSKVHQSMVEKLEFDKVPVTAALGVLGMPGRTAWFGLMEAGQPKPGETVVVSGAAGAVGSLVVQFAKKAGCRVIAFAGSEQKCQWLQQQLNVDLAINYVNFANHTALNEYLKQQAIKVDVYFDNVGGLISDAVIPQINKRARIIICGQMSQYNGQLDEVELGPRFLHHLLYQRATIQGILARDYSHRMDEMLASILPWLEQQSLHYQETVVEGFDKLPEYLASLFKRASVGKLLVKIAD